VSLPAFSTSPEPDSIVTETQILESESYPLPAPVIHTPSGLIATSELSGTADSVQTAKGKLISQARVSEQRLAENSWQAHKHLPGISLVLGNSAGANCYYHWMLDLLPKLGYLQNLGITVSDIDHLLVREATAPFQRESLDRLGVTPTQIVETANHPYFHCDEAWVLNLDHRVNMTMNRWVPKWLRGLFVDPEQSIERDTKLYITRPPGVRRGINNEDEFLPLLQEHGFTIVVLISPHGGALTNMVFSNPGLSVIELFGSHVYPYYYGLSNLCGHHYQAVLPSGDHYPQLTSLSHALSAGTAENQLESQTQSFDVSIDVLARALSQVT